MTRRTGRAGSGRQPRRSRQRRRPRPRMTPNRTWTASRTWATSTAEPPGGPAVAHPARRPDNPALSVAGRNLRLRRPRHAAGAPGPAARRQSRGARSRVAGRRSPGAVRMVVKKVGVVGCGLMGHGIAQVAAQAGCTVVARESDQGALDKGIARVKKSLDKLVEKEKISRADADAASGRISGTLDLKGLSDCDLVVEAIVENLDVKKKLFAELGRLCKPGTIFASNTSSFSIGEMGTASGRPERMVGLH